MKRLGAVVVVSLAGFVAAVIVFSSPERRGCPLKADTDRSYTGRFEGAVSVQQTTHVLQVSRNGRPLTGAKLCVNTEMIGMSGMGYSATASERSPGRYQVGFRFGMAGDYRTNLIAKNGFDEVSIPLVVKVRSGR
ncbi:MAG: FixH family protein [Solirubrobacterales bacterium]|nr:FixH family protein [Solirubrobacterales bacterium]